MYAATEGQLSHLKNFPEPDIKSLESYIYTTLLFKNSLSTLWLNDDSLSFGPQLASLDAYRTLSNSPILKPVTSSFYL